MLSIVDRRAGFLARAAGLLWIALNARFMGFLRRERGGLYALRSWAVTFVDRHVMLVGAACGCRDGGRTGIPFGADLDFPR